MNKFFLLTLLMSGATFLTAFGQFFFKLGSALLTGVLSIFNIYIILGAFLYGIAFLIYAYCLSKYELSVTYPFLSLSFIWTTILGYLLLNESLAYTHFISVAAIITGLFLIGRGDKK